MSETDEESADSGESPESPEALPEVDLDNERKWFALMTKFIGDRTIEPDHCGRVQFAYDQMYIAACERLHRYFRSDLPPEDKG